MARCQARAAAFPLHLSGDETGRADGWNVHNNKLISPLQSAWMITENIKLCHGVSDG